MVLADKSAGLSDLTLKLLLKSRFDCGNQTAMKVSNQRMWLTRSRDTSRGPRGHRHVGLGQKWRLRRCQI